MNIHIIMLSLWLTLSLMNFACAQASLHRKDIIGYVMNSFGLFFSIFLSLVEFHR